MKDPVKDLAERSVEVIDLNANVVGLRVSCWPHHPPRETPADLIALAAPDSHVTTRALFQLFDDLDGSCEQLEGAGLDHSSCLYAMTEYERQDNLIEFKVTWDPELRF